jgi:DNA invertase Pin-like site-specific DNA recombinase
MTKIKGENYMYAIYARQSVDKKDSISIDSQIDFCKKEFPSNTEYKVYIDKGFSGGNTQRPDFEILMNDIANNNIDTVVVYKLDRISRSIVDFAKIIEFFKEHDVKFISATEKFDTSTPMGNAMLNITMVFAQLERETIQKRIKDNYYARGKKGFFMGGKTPYGYIKEPFQVDGIKTSILKPSPTEHSILLKMFELYSTTNISLGKLAEHLNQEGYKSPHGKNWESQKIQRILRNPVYVKADAEVYNYYKNKSCIITNDLTEFIGTNGCYLFGKRDRNLSKYNNIKDHTLSIALHNGLVESYTWLLCQYKLDNNKQIKNSGRGKHTWLSGLTKCAYCNYAMTVKTFKDYKYFSCSGRTNFKVCNTKQITHHVCDIEEFVQEELFNRINTVRPIELDPNNNSTPEINQLKIELTSVNEQIDNLLNQLAQGNCIAMEYINSKITELDSRKNELVNEIQSHTVKSIAKSQIFDSIEMIKDWDNLSLEEKKSIAKSWIDKVLISNETIDITWIH